MATGAIVCPMADAANPPADGAGLLGDLSDEQRAELDSRGYVKVGLDLAWIEPGGRERREPLDRLYYVHTLRGMFRVSLLTGDLVEV